MSADFPASTETFSVSQLNRQVRGLLESNFDFIWVEGEISNFAAPSSGHWYFSLKDDDAQVRCAMFKNRNHRVRFRAGNGEHVRLRCRVSLYEGRGEFQLIVEHMEHAGEGALQAAFERLKAKLLAEGLFDPTNKRPLPDSIDRLGVITSPTGAALQDVLNVLRRRWPAMAVYVLPVAVQGENAAPEIVAAIDYANQLAERSEVALDALIVGRGGGSLEDLWAFNEESVARAIAASRLPIVSAVGHEVDFTIADLAADVRAPTPSAAAELLSPDQEIWRQRLGQLEKTLLLHIGRQLHAAQTRLDHLAQRLRHPGQQIQDQSQRLDELEQRLLRAQQQQLSRQQARLDLLETRLRGRSPVPRIRALQDHLAYTRQRLDHAIQQRLQDRREQLALMAKLLDSVSPLATLERGYAVLTDSAGNIVQKSSDTSAGSQLKAKLAEGILQVTVDEVIAEKG